MINLIVAVHELFSLLLPSRHLQVPAFLCFYGWSGTVVATLPDNLSRASLRTRYQEPGWSFHLPQVDAR